jgi:hypothetical protein
VIAFHKTDGRSRLAGVEKFRKSVHRFEGELGLLGRKPDTDASSEYRQQSQRVASTRYHGNMELRFHDDGSSRAGSGS